MRPLTAHDLLDLSDAPTRLPDWYRDALCIEHQDDAYWWSTASGAGQERAKVVCRRCPVMDECRAYALAEAIEYDVWGGMTASERKALGRRVA